MWGTVPQATIEGCCSCSLAPRPSSDSRAVSPLGTYDGALTVSADTPVDLCARWDRITGDLDALNGNQRVDVRLTRIESSRSVNVRRSAP